MARTFAATSSYIAVGAGQMASVAMSYGTVAAIVKRATVGGAFFGMLSYAATVATATQASFELDTSSNLYISYDGTTNARYTTTAYTSTTDWYLFAYSKATGSVFPRAHIYNYTTNTWEHGNGDLAISDGSATTGAIFTIGGFGLLGDFFSGEIAAAGYWRTWTPTDTEFEELGLPFSRMAWLSATARADRSWVAFLDQNATTTPVRDLYGGGQQSSTSATVPTISTNSVPNFGWGGPVIFPNPTAPVVPYKPNNSNYRYKMAVQRASTW
jgi:hypothetical protein